MSFQQNSGNNLLHRRLVQPLKFAVLYHLSSTKDHIIYIMISDYYITVAEFIYHSKHADKYPFVVFKKMFNILPRQMISTRYKYAHGMLRGTKTTVNMKTMFLFYTSNMCNC